MKVCFYHCIRSFLSAVRGGTAIEYTLIAAGVAVAIAGTVFVIGGDLVGFFSSVDFTGGG